ncbi:unnamed protein product [Oikopleura dioica]|uniref:MAM domain-containing protein n=1 Tax=Oikopleura dioica TaxID=34765 RepID=E4XNM6_OIKDI|nr:unnamed protein product [Oikopleura dioica]
MRIILFCTLLLTVLDQEKTLASATSRRRPGKPDKGKSSKNCSINPFRRKRPSRRKASKDRVECSFWKVEKATKRCRKTVNSNGTSQRKSCRPLEWKLVENQPELKARAGHYLVANAKNSKDQMNPARFMSKGIRYFLRRKKRQLCLTFKQAVFCESNKDKKACGFHGDDKNAPMGLFVKVVYIRKDNTKAERTIWERIDAEGEPGIWTTTDPINIMDARYFEDDGMNGYSPSRKKKQQPQIKKNSKIRISIEAQRGSARNSIVAIDDIKIEYCNKKPATPRPKLTRCEEILKTDPKCSGKRCKSENCITIEPVELGPMREKAAYLPEMIIENFSPRGVFYDNEMSPPINWRKCKYSELTEDFNFCLKAFAVSDQIRCSDRYVQLERCMKTVAEKCAEKFDEDLLEDAFLKNELFDYFKTMRLFERLCTKESTRLVISSHMYEPDCPSSQKYEQQRCTALAFEPNPLTADGELNCSQWSDTRKCHSKIIDSCSFYSGLDLILLGVGNAIQDWLPCPTV